MAAEDGPQALTGPRRQSDSDVSALSVFRPSWLSDVAERIRVTSVGMMTESAAGGRFGGQLDQVRDRAVLVIVSEKNKALGRPVLLKHREGSPLRNSKEGTDTIQARPRRRRDFPS